VVGCLDRAASRRGPRVHRGRAVVPVLDHGGCGGGPVRQRVRVVRRPRPPHARARQDRSLLVGRGGSTCSSLPAQLRHGSPQEQADGRSGHHGQGRQHRRARRQARHGAVTSRLDRRPLQRFRADWRRRRLRARQLGIRPLLRGPDGAPQSLPGPSREGAVHGVQGRHRRPRHQGRRRHRRRRTGPVRGRLGHRRPLLGGQQRRVRDGADLPRPRFHDRTSGGVRPPRGAPHGTAGREESA